MMNSRNHPTAEAQKEFRTQQFNILKEQEAEALRFDFFRQPIYNCTDNWESISYNFVKAAGMNSQLAESNPYFISELMEGYQFAIGEYIYKAEKDDGFPSWEKIAETHRKASEARLDMIREQHAEIEALRNCRASLKDRIAGMAEEIESLRIEINILSDSDSDHNPDYSMIMGGGDCR